MKSEYVIALQDAMNKKCSETKLSLIEMYNKYSVCYDCKAETKPLAFFYCLLMNPKLMTQSDFASNSLPVCKVFPQFCIEKFLTKSNYIICKVGTNYTQCVHRICLSLLISQGRIDDLTVINFENFQRYPPLDLYRGEPTLVDGRIPSLLEPPNTGVGTQNLTEDPPAVNINFRFPIAPAPVPVGLAAVPAPVPPPAPAAAPASLVAPDTADVAAEPQTQERPQLPTRDVRFTNDDIFQNDESPNFIPSTSTSDNSNFSLRDNDLQKQDQKSNERQGPLLAPHSSEAMPTVDQGTLLVYHLLLVKMKITTAALILRLEIQFTPVIFVLLFNLKAKWRNLLVQICLNLLMFVRDYYLRIIERKSFKTKYRLKRAIF